jgi:membrane protein YdbS with pleckstrin-like domain
VSTPEVSRQAVSPPANPPPQPPPAPKPTRASRVVTSLAAALFLLLAAGFVCVAVALFRAALSAPPAP